MQKPQSSPHQRKYTVLYLTSKDSQKNTKAAQERHEMMISVTGSGKQLEQQLENTTP